MGDHSQDVPGTIGAADLSRLEDYAENLLAFIESNDAITPRDQEQRYTKTGRTNHYLPV